MNLKSKINKLQQGLQFYGVIYLINRQQIYLSSKNAICTKYVVKEPIEIIDKKSGELKRKQTTVFESFSQIELVKFLAEKIREVQNGPI